MNKLFLLFIICINVFIGCTNEVAENKLIEEIIAQDMLLEENKILSDAALKISSRIPKTLNPLLNEDVTVNNVLNLLFEPLAILDEDLRVIPNLAEEFIYSAVDNSITVKMKNNIFWHNGERVTANDVLYSLNLLKNSASPQSIYKHLVTNIVSYNVIDELTIRINYNINPFKSSYSLCIPIISSNYHKNDFTPGSVTNMTPMGNGPFKFLEYNEVNSINLTKNNDYFKGSPLINTVEVVITSDTETDFYAFDQRIIDVISTPLARWSRYRGLKETKNVEYITNQYDFIGFNFNNSYLHDRRIRQAIAYGLNIDDMIKDVYLEQALKTLVPINPLSWLYAEDLTEYEFDIEKSKALLRQAGFEHVNEEGFVYRNNNGMQIQLNFNILVNEENEERVKVAKILKEMLKEIGINSELDIRAFTEYQVALESKNYDIVVAGLNLSLDSNLDFLFNSVNNYFSYKNEVMDLQLNTVLNLRDEEEYKRYMSNIQKTIINDVPVISLVFRKSSLVVDRKLNAVQNPNMNNIYNQINLWYISE